MPSKTSNPKPITTTAKPGFQFSFEAIGTSWTIEIFQPLAAVAAKKLRQDIMRRIEVYDTAYSRFRPDSLVTLMSRKKGTYTVPDDAKPLMDLYQKLYAVTRGAVTPLIGETLAAAGYDANYSLQPEKVSPPPKWEDALEYDFPHLTIKRSVLLDFGAAGKGYLVDIIAALMQEQGIDSFYINAGGDILYRGSTPIDIALEHPADPELAIGIAHVRGQSLCGSAGNRRKWSTYHHILDPQSLSSPQHIAALWVAAPSGLVADGLSTALFFTDPKEPSKHFDFEYAIMHADMSLSHSPGFPADFFTKS